MPQGISADLIATLEGFSREELDRFALESQQRAGARHRRGPLREEPRSRGRIARRQASCSTATSTRAPTPRSKRSRRSSRRSWSSARPPPGPNGETLDELALARYPEVKAIEHVHTAGNSSGIVDGAAAVLLASRRLREAHRR